MSSIKIQKQEIATILELIVEQSQTILAYPDGQIPQIELDIARENIRKLYNNYSILDKINSLIIDRVTQNVVDEMIPKTKTNIEVHEPLVEVIIPAKIPTEIKHKEPKQEILESIETVESPVEEIVEEKVVEAITETVFPEIMEVEPEPIIAIEAEIIVSEPTIQEIIQPVEEKIIEQVTPEIQPISEPVIEKPAKQIKDQKLSTGNLFDSPATSIADKFKDNKPSLHEKIGSDKSDNTLANKLQQKPISDLVKSIGINDKFLLIKELFKNNGEEYNEAIQLLNNFSTIMQAFDYLDVLKQKYSWDESSDASLKLFDLIRRKYQQ